MSVAVKISKKLLTLYPAYVNILTFLQDVFLLIIRVYWGYRFCRTGLGKLQNMPNTIDFFTSLGIPFPEINAYVASLTECIGGVCLLLGLGSRVLTLPLIFTMIIAYITADSEAVSKLFIEPEKFLKAEPFLFMLTSIIVLLFGAGRFSVDHLFLRRFFSPSTNKKK